MRDRCFFLSFSFLFWQKNYFVARCYTDLFIAVEKTKDKTHEKLLISLVGEISDIFANVNVNRLRPTFVALQVARKNSRLTPHFATAIVALRVARNVERPSTFRNVARQVAFV